MSVRRSWTLEKGAITVKCSLQLFVGIAAVSIASTAVWARGNCQDIPTVWTVGSSQDVDGAAVAARIYSDGQPYTDGTRGVASAIKACSGTYDAVLTVDSGRTILFNLAGSYLLDSTYPAPPLWTSNGPFASPPSPTFHCSGSPCTVLNVRNILDFGSASRAQYYKLFTRLDSAFVAPNGVSYHLVMHNATTSNVAANSSDTFVDSPFQNARVVVEHFPASQTVKEYWVVYPETPLVTGSLSPSPENATLLSNDKSTDYGEFSLPFFLTITTK